MTPSRAPKLSETPLLPFARTTNTFPPSVLLTSQRDLSNSEWVELPHPSCPPPSIKQLLPDHLLFRAGNLEASTTQPGPFHHFQCCYHPNPFDRTVRLRRKICRMLHPPPLSLQLASQVFQRCSLQHPGFSATHPNGPSPCRDIRPLSLAGALGASMTLATTTTCRPYYTPLNNSPNESYPNYQKPPDTRPPCQDFCPRSLSMSLDNACYNYHLQMLLITRTTPQRAVPKLPEASRHKTPVKLMNVQPPS